MNVPPLRSIALCFLPGFLCGEMPTAVGAPVATERSAAAIAEAAFLHDTEHKVTDYSVHPGKHTDIEWYFLLRARRNFWSPEITGLWPSIGERGRAPHVSFLCS